MGKSPDDERRGRKRDAVTITWLMLSLRKASTSQEYGWSLGEPATKTTLRFAERQGITTTGDNIGLDSFASSGGGA